MANQNQVKYLAAGTGATYWGPGDELRFLITGEETNGAFCIMEASVAPGGGPPPHIHHREDESFFLLQGALTVNVGDKTLHASPGDFVHLPRGIAHSFKNTSNVDAKMLVTITPAGLEKFFEAVFDLAVPGGVPPQMGPEMKARAMAAAPKVGLELLMPVAH
jgi:quercetin dioxygenase-like cupin family protein